MYIVWYLHHAWRPRPGPQRSFNISRHSPRSSLLNGEPASPQTFSQSFDHIRWLGIASANQKKSTILTLQTATTVRYLIIPSFHVASVSEHNKEVPIFLSTNKSNHGINVLKAVRTNGKKQAMCGRLAAMRADYFGSGEGRGGGWSLRVPTPPSYWLLRCNVHLAVITFHSRRLGGRLVGGVSFMAPSSATASIRSKRSLEAI